MMLFELIHALVFKLPAFYIELTPQLVVTMVGLLGLAWFEIGLLSKHR
jgi:hypothetical protein